MDETLFHLDQEHDWTMALRPYFIHDNVMYFACFQNDFEKSEINIQIMEFNFKGDLLVTQSSRTEKMETSNSKDYPGQGQQIYCT